jgi:hypothetical protein
MFEMKFLKKIIFNFFLIYFQNSVYIWIDFKNTFNLMNLFYIYFFNEFSMFNIKIK